MIIDTEVILPKLPPDTEMIQKTTRTIAADPLIFN